MISIKITPKNRRAAIRAAARVLKRGGVVAYPTETTYGLGCDPRNTKAVAKIYRIKGREKKKPLLLVAASVAQVKMIAVLVGASLALARRYWPGPLTLVLPAKRTVHGSRITVHGRLAIRVTSSSIANAIAKSFGFPIVSTSANRSGKADARSGRDIHRAFGTARHQPDLLLDAGTLPKRKPSTIVKAAPDGSFSTLRQGAVRLSGISSVAPKKKESKDRSRGRRAQAR